VVAHDEVQRGAAVPAFGEFGEQHGDLVEEIERQPVFLLGDRLVCPLQQQIAGGAARIAPARPDAVGDAFGFVGVALAFQVVEQRVERLALQRFDLGRLGRFRGRGLSGSPARRGRCVRTENGA
jgi:hypothetical protein